MKTLSRIGTLFAPALVSALLLAAAPGAHADGDSQPKSPSRLARLLPDRLQVGPHFGFTASRFTGSSEYKSLIEPTPASREAWTAPSYGAFITARWRSGISLTFSPRYESYGVDTREETVSFPDNPFPHTLESSTELGYDVWPLLLGFGWFNARQHFQIQLGTYAAFLDHADINWTVDGQPYPNRPQPNVRETQTGWILATEYGLRMGPGELILGMETQRQAHSLMGGLPGTVKAQSARLSLAYAWTVMQR